MKIIFLSVALFLSACANQQLKMNEKSEQEKNKTHFINIFSDSNEVVAKVDTNDGKVTYYKSAEEAFDIVLKAFLNTSKSLEQCKKGSKPLESTGNKKK